MTDIGFVYVIGFFSIGLIVMVVSLVKARHTCDVVRGLKKFSILLGLLAVIALDVILMPIVYRWSAFVGVVLLIFSVALIGFLLYLYCDID